MNQSRLFLTTLVALFVFSSSAALADDSAASSVTFSDGAVATSFDHCGDTDLCATIKYANGDVLSIYSEGAAYCQPYQIDFVRVNGTATIYEYTRVMNHDAPRPTAFGVGCGHSQTTQMVMDHGLVHLTVSEDTDGTLKLVFSK